MYFKTLGRIGYTTSLDATGTVPLTTFVDDGGIGQRVVSKISIRPVNDAPRLLTAVTLPATTLPTLSSPLEITYAQVLSATQAFDVEKSPLSFQVQAVTAGKLERWNGTTWSAVSTARSSPLAQRLLGPGQKLRWTPAASFSGSGPAFVVRASDGVLASVSSQISVAYTPV